jgi:hypoxanthine phosphoribosyltransferase
LFLFNILKISPQQANGILAASDLLHDAAQVDAAVSRVASAINAALADAHPLALVVLHGAVVFAGQLLPRLAFPLDVDSVDATRYSNQTDRTRGGEVAFRALPSADVAGRTVLLIDDILDEGVTLAAIRDKLLSMQARQVVTAVLVEKSTGRPKPLAADFVGLAVPNRYVFGYGMDVHGYWRNLPSIHAMKE